jgi:formate dehydrogenase maturation protein FdhE
VNFAQVDKAVPLVDDIASVELDLWADVRGLRKIERNVLGL